MRQRIRLLTSMLLQWQNLLFLGESKTYAMKKKKLFFNWECWTKRNESKPWICATFLCVRSKHVLKFRSGVVFFPIGGQTETECTYCRYSGTRHTPNIYNETIDWIDRIENIFVLIYVLFCQPIYFHCSMNVMRTKAMLLQINNWCVVGWFEVVRTYWKCV